MYDSVIFSTGIKLVAFEHIQTISRFFENAEAVEGDRPDFNEPIAMAMRDGNECRPFSDVYFALRNRFFPG